MSQKKKIKTKTKEEYSLENPLFVARFNFEQLKALFKKDPNISKASKNQRIDPDKFKIIRFRESNTTGEVVKSIDRVRVKDSPYIQKYIDMAKEMYGVKIKRENGYVYFDYDIIQIDKDREEWLND